MKTLGHYVAVAPLSFAGQSRILARAMVASGEKIVFWDRSYEDGSWAVTDRPNFYSMATVEAEEWVETADKRCFYPDLRDAVEEAGLILTSCGGLVSSEEELLDAAAVAVCWSDKFTLAATPPWIETLVNWRREFTEEEYLREFDGVPFAHWIVSAGEQFTHVPEEYWHLINPETGKSVINRMVELSGREFHASSPIDAMVDARGVNPRAQYIEVLLKRNESVKVIIDDTPFLANLVGKGVCGDRFVGMSNLYFEPTTNDVEFDHEFYI